MPLWGGEYWEKFDIMVSLHLKDLWRDTWVNLNGYTWCGANNNIKKPDRFHIYKDILLIKKPTSDYSYYSRYS